MIKQFISLVFIGSFLATVYAQETTRTIKLKAPDLKGEMTLMQALSNRKTDRSFKPEMISGQELSDLLWAAYGINREDGKRTAPSTMDFQEIELYISLETGLYFYNAKDHSLELIADADLREDTGLQPFVKEAPINLIYVSDFSKMGKMSDQEKDSYSHADSSFISQNVYLYCASKKLGTVVRGFINKEVLSAKMKLPENKKIIFSQTVGYIKN